MLPVSVVVLGRVHVGGCTPWQAGPGARTHRTPGNRRATAARIADRAARPGLVHPPGAAEHRRMATTDTTGLRWRGWQQEAALRMLENNRRPDVAERPE